MLKHSNEAILSAVGRGHCSISIVDQVTSAVAGTAVSINSEY